MDLNDLNNSELQRLIYINKRVRKEGTNEELINDLNGGQSKDSKFTNSRNRLKVFLETNKKNFSTSLPCYGKSLECDCIRFNCSDVTHVSCYNGLKNYL